MPDQPLQVLVLAIPAHRFSQLAENAMVGDDSRGSLRRLALTLDESALDEYVSASVRTGHDGHYALDLLPGSYVICLADTGPTSAAASPVYIFGAIESTIDEGEPSARDIFKGIQGVTDR